MVKSASKKLGYHYCSVDTFMQIIENKTLWLSHSRTMNDKLECVYILDILKQVIEDVNYQDNSEKSILNEIEKSCKNNVDYPYITSLSKNKDLLSQWRAYGDNGKGVAIGLDLSKIPHKDLLGNGDPASNIIIDEVCYKTKTIYSILKKMLETIPYLTDKYIERKPIVEYICQFIKILSAFTKNSTFSEEKEYRICYFPCYRYLLKNLYKENVEIEQHLDLKFRTKNSEIISYFEYNFSDDVVSEIVLGPTTRVNKNQLTLFLSQYLPNIKIKNKIIDSKIPLTY